jgi:hypothetical protein
MLIILIILIVLVHLVIPINFVVIRKPSIIGSPTGDWCHAPVDKAERFHKVLDTGGQETLPPHAH